MENLVLREQVAVLNRRKRRLKLGRVNKLFWVAIRRVWTEWSRSLVIVTPETVLRWHRAGFRIYWSWRSGCSVRCGRKRISRELRELIFQMVAENPTWGAPGVHGELLKLGFDLSERTVSRWMQRASHKTDASRRWKTLLSNHREAIAAMDFFTVSTITFGVLHCFFVISHDRRKILRFSVTRHPSALWIVQQLREAWPYKSTHKFLLFDHDSKFGKDVVTAVREMGSEPVRTAYRSPWQNGVAERLVQSCRRDLLDHVIVLNERHLKRLMAEYIRYYHEDRTHLGLSKDTPAGRLVSDRPPMGASIRSFPRLGGLHHRYSVAA